MWILAMLEFEAALALAGADAGVVPSSAAQAIAACCTSSHVDLAAVERDAGEDGNPVIPLVRALSRAVPEDAEPYVHLGATSQDVIDSATMLVLRRGLGTLEGELGLLIGRCASLAIRHRATPMVGRTLLQHAVPITFGLKAIAWTMGVGEARTEIARVRTTRLALQFGGAVGTRASLGRHATAVARALSARLGLPVPFLSWHTSRARIAETASALAITAGAAAKIAQDVVLLSQTEVGEVSEARGGSSSSMPHKRNASGSISVLAAKRRVDAAAGLLLGSMVQEHERAAGAWQAEWVPLREALQLTQDAVSRMTGVLATLVVDTERMRANLESFGGLAMAEQLAATLAPHVGRSRAHELVAGACAAGDLRKGALAEPAIVRALTTEGVERALDPAGPIDAACALVDESLTVLEECR